MLTVRKRWTDIAIVVALFGAVTALALGGLVRADRASSKLEARTLAQRPAVRWADLVSGGYGRNVETYLSDQFFGRDTWVRYYTLLNLDVLGKAAMNGAVAGKGGVLLGDDSAVVPLTDAQIGPALDAKMKQLDELNALVRSYGGTLIVVGHPTKNSFLRADYPFGFGLPSDVDRVTARYFPALDRAGIANVNMVPIFDRHSDEKLYSVTDHHWTFAGAFLTYTALMQKLGRTPLRLSDLDTTTLPNPFVGSLNRKLAMTFPEKEKLLIAAPKVPIPYTRAQSGVSAPDFDVMPKSPKKAIAYSVYDQGDQAEVVVDTNRPKLPTLLMFGDSFTNPIETLLWTGFDQTRYLDLRHYTKMTLEDYVRTYKPDYVVALVRDELYLDRFGNGCFTRISATDGADE